jgi:tRNA threonylcarbamoyl adenosine modification protein YeaZ
LKVLAIDTSGSYLNLGIVDDNFSLIYLNSNEDLKSHSINILPGIDQLLDKAGWSFSDINKIVVTKGPGSFTGLRIGGTVAKILADQLSIPLVVVSTLLATYKSQTTKLDKMYIPIIDARNQNVFAGGYQNGNNIFDDGHYPISYLIDKYPGAIFIVPKTVNQNFELINKIVVDDEKLINAEVLANLDGEIVDPKTFAPSYLRKTQAEMNWLNDHNIGEFNDGVSLAD